MTPAEFLPSSELEDFGIVDGWSQDLHLHLGLFHLEDGEEVGNGDDLTNY